MQDAPVEGADPLEEPPERLVEPRALMRGQRRAEDGEAHAGGPPLPQLGPGLMGLQEPLVPQLLEGRRDGREHDGLVVHLLRHVMARRRIRGTRKGVTGPQHRHHEARMSNSRMEQTGWREREWRLQSVGDDGPGGKQGCIPGAF